MLLFDLFRSLLCYCFINLDPYCVISFGRYSQTTRYVPESLCPTWDETRIFDGIRIFGDPRVLLESPPPIVIELFDKDTVVCTLSIIVVIYPFLLSYIHFQ